MRCAAFSMARSAPRGEGKSSQPFGWPGDRMLVSAIIPLYNSERFLAQTLDSALAQSWRNLEIIIVDDGSTDASAAIADHYAREYPDAIRVIHQRNEGLCHARNTAMAAARGDCFALLDADDIWL